MIDVNQITSTLRTMPDRALQQYAAMNKGNPYVLALAVAESNQRKQLRTAAQARTAAPQPKVADAAIAGMAEMPAVDAMGNVTGMASGGLPEDHGIGRLPAPNMQRMADGGIAGYDDGGMADGGSMFDFAQRSEPVLRMSGGGAVPGFASGVWNNSRFLEYLKQNGLTAKFAKGSDDEKKAIIDAFGDATSGPQKAAPPAPAAAAASNTGKSYELGQKVGPTVKAASEKLANIGTTKTSKLPLGSGPLSTGVVGLGAGLYEGYTQGDFYNDPNVSALAKAKQAGLTSLRAGLPMVGAGAGSLFSPIGTAVGTLAGTGAAALLPSEVSELEEWKKAHPQAAAPASAKKQEQNVRDKAAVTAGDITLPEAAPEKPGAAPAGMGAPAGVTAADIEKMYSQFAGTKDERAAKSQDIKNQLGSLVGSETLAAQKQYDQLQADIAAQGPYGKDKEARLKAKEERIGKEEGQAGGLALLEAGLAIMGGTSTNAFANIGQGAMAGTAAYRKSQERLADARDKLDDAFGRLEDVRFNQKNMNAKELREAKSGIDKAVNTGLARLIDYGVKDLGMEREDAKNMLGSYTHLKQAETTAAPHWASAQAQQKRYNQTDKERADYIKLQNSVFSNLQKDDNYKMADVATQAQMKVAAMRQALQLNPHLAQYSAGLGFDKAPTGQVLELQ